MVLLIVTVHWTRSFSQIPSLLQISAFRTFQMNPVALSTRFLRLYCRATQQGPLSSDEKPKQGLSPVACSLSVLAPRFPDPATPSQCLLPSLLTYSEQCISLTLHFCQIKKKMDFRKQTIQRLLQQREGDVAIGRTRAPDPKMYEHLSGQGERWPIVWGGVNKARRNRSWGSR